MVLMLTGKMFLFHFQGLFYIYSRNTPLHEAARRGNAHMVEILLENGASKNLKNVVGLSVFHGKLQPSSLATTITKKSPKFSSKRIVILHPEGLCPSPVL